MGPPTPIMCMMSINTRRFALSNYVCNSRYTCRIYIPTRSRCMCFAAAAAAAAARRGKMHLDFYLLVAARLGALWPFIASGSL